MMGCRYQGLQQMLAGFEKTGVDLIGYDGTKLFPSDGSDDVGFYYVVPKLVRFFGISLDRAIDFFLYGTIFVALVLSVTGFFLLSKSWPFRIFATLWLVFFSWLACRDITDVYLVQYTITIGTVPLFLYLIRKNQERWSFPVFLFVVGLAAGYAHYIRAFSSFAVILFFLFGLLFLFRGSWKKKAVFVGVLLCGIIIPRMHMSRVLGQRKNFFGQSCQDCASRHVFWHTVYAGFGFLSNDLGLKWDDKTIADRVKEVAPEAIYPTKAYEDAARLEVFKLIRDHFAFVRITLFAKLGVIFYYFLLFANIGFFVSLFYKKSWILELMFWCAIGFNSLFGFIALPGRYYLMGMLAFAILYGLVSVEYAISQGISRDIRNFLSRVLR